MPPACLDDVAARALIQGELMGAALAAVDAHLDGCVACMTLVQGLVGGAGPVDEGPATVALVGSRFRVLSLIAEGGMGRIYRAIDRELERAVALKVPRANNAALRRRFEREVAITARLEHPGVVPIHGAGTTDDGLPYYVMRIIDGTPLDERLQLATTSEARRPLLRHIVAVAETVAYAHARGVVHRDLKPANVLVGQFGETFVIDWGLAKELGGPSGAVAGSVPSDAVTVDEASRATLPGHGASSAMAVAHGSPIEPTQAGDVLGTPAFMAPEQARGEVTDARADVFALGVMLRMVLGPDGATVSPELAAVAARATAATPEARYPDAGALATELHAFQAGQRVSAYRYGVVARARRVARRHRTALAVAGVATVALLALATSAYVRVDDARARATAQRTRAEALTAQLLDELGSEARAFGRTSIMRGVGGAVADYYRAREPAGDPVQAALRWSQADGLAREAALELDDVPAATTAATTELTHAEQAFALRVDNTTRGRLASAVTGTALVAQRQGDVAAARAALQRCQVLTAAHDDAVVAEHWLACGTLRALLERDAGAVAAARTVLAQLNDETARLRQRAPTDVRWMMARGRALAAAASLHADEGPAGVAARYDAALALLQDAAVHGPFDSRLLEAIGGVNHDLAVAQQQAGNVVAATAALDRGDTAVRRLLAIDPARGRWRLQLASLACARGDLDVTVGKYAEAQRSYDAASEPLRTLVAAAPRDAKYALHLGLALSGHAAATWLAGDLPTAATEQAAAIIAMEAAFAIDARVDAAQDIVEARRRQASIEVDRGNLQGALPLLQQARVRLDTFALQFPTHAAWPSLRYETMALQFGIHRAASANQAAHADLLACLALAWAAATTAPGDVNPRANIAVTTVTLAYAAEPAMRVKWMPLARAALADVAGKALSVQDTPRVALAVETFAALEAEAADKVRR